MNETLTQLGIGATLTVVVLKTVFDFLGKKKNGNGHINEDRMKSLLRDSQKDIIEEVRRQGHDMRNVVAEQMARMRLRDPRA